MLDGADPKGTPLKDALFETFVAKHNDATKSIPKFVKKSLGMLRRDANEIRKYNGKELLTELV